MGILPALAIDTSRGWDYRRDNLGLAGLVICGPHKFKTWGLFALISFVLYAIIVIFYSQSFTIVILNYLPAMIALLVAAIIGYRKSHSNSFVFIAAGVLISFVAAFIQQQGI